MKINISHLGIIKHAQIELKPFTVFLGENGTCKTWAAYTIAGLLGPYGRQRYLEAYLNGKTATFEAVEDAIETLTDKGAVTIDLRKFVVDHLERYINEIARLIPEWLGIFMATKRVRFDKTVVSVEITMLDMGKIMKVLEKTGIEAKRSVGKNQNILLALKAVQDKENLYFYITNESVDIPSLIKNREARVFVVNALFGTLSMLLAHNTPVFPVERTAWVTLPVTQKKDTKDQQKVDVMQDEEEVNQSRYVVLSEPVRYFFAMINTAQSRYFDREKEGRDNPEINKLIKLAHFLEENVLDGKVDFEDREGGTDILYTPAGAKSLEIHVASSMIKDIASLSIYLKYLANPRDLIVIDEPEMNLHPSAQAKMTEFMGMLVNAGLSLLITTHSPYIVDHLTNLMSAFDSPDKSSIKDHFYLGREDAFVPKELVSVYLFNEKGEVKNMLSEDKVIDWDTFSDVSREISEIYSHIA